MHVVSGMHTYIEMHIGGTNALIMVMIVVDKCHHGCTEYQKTLLVKHASLNSHAQ